MMAKWHFCLWHSARVSLFLIHMLSLATDASGLTFTRPSYTGNIKECSVACEKLYVTTEHRMGIHTPNPSDVANVKYRITKSSRTSDPTNQFKAELLRVGDFAFLFIRTKTDGSTNLNREWKSFYSLNVKAVITFTNGTQEDTVTRVDVTILDINDAPPLFTQLKYTFDVPESTDLFSTVGNVQATDADEGFNADIYYSFENWMPEFAVHPTLGDVYSTRNMTTASKRQYSNYIVASNRGAGRQTKAEIVFNIIQRNDNIPEFIVNDRPPVNAYAPVGITILLIKVLDVDSGSNGDIQSVEIISAMSSNIGDVRLYFSLRPTPLSQPHAAEYQLQVAESLRDIGHQVNITIQAWDNGTPVKSATTTISLDVITSNKELQEEETVFLEIDEGLPAGTPLHYIAPPKDSLDATYRIASDDLDVFRVHSTSGVLFLKKPVDAEKSYQTRLEVRLRAKLSVLERFEYTVKFIVTIRDENDNSPVFSPSIEKPVAENSPVGTLVTIASATDADSGDNALITYSLTNSDQLPFQIDPFNGEIRLSGSMDYDVGPKLYHLTVRASDRGSPYRRETEKVFTVSVENVNDNKPIFEYARCELKLSKDLSGDYRVSQVTAKDLDGSLNSLTYSIRSATLSHTLLSIDADSGIVSTTESLHPYVDRTYSYYVSVSDGSHTAEEPLEFIVKVEDSVPNYVQVECSESAAKRAYQDALKLSQEVNPSREDLVLSSTEHLTNQHRPVFADEFVTSSTQYSLPEDLPLGSIVTHITASDEDLGFAGLIQYTIAAGNSLGHFAINGSTGALIVFAPLDRETIPKYTLTVVASDSADRNPKNTSIIIRLNILDANDNSPRFLSDLYYEAYINETASITTTVLQVMARDDDIDNNGRIQYSLVTETPFFAIDETTGKIMVRGILDRESKDRHILEVKASDMPGGHEEVRFATTTVIIHITDVNDNAPQFMKPEFVVKVREDIPVGTVITNLVAQDADLPATGGEVTYKIIKGVEDVFHIDKYTGIVKLMKKLDYELKTIYRITVRARDNGTIPLKSNCDLVVEVIDVNENTNRPVFDQLAYEQLVDESVPSGTTVLQVKAIDNDVAVSDHRLSYSIRGGSGLGSFTIDDEGYIKTAILLDRETTPFYWLTVFVEDYGSVPLSSSVDVYIQVKDVNDNAPQPSQPVYYVEVKENSPANLAVAHVLATDSDETSDITYSITGGNTQSAFTIDSVTGVIKTTRRTLDRESEELITLEVMISDGSPGSALSSTVQVWITVTDENDNSPVWNTQGKLTVPVLRSHDKSKPVYRVIASDEDKGENGNISYSIPQSSDQVLWRIDPATGELFLKSDWPSSNQVSVKVRAADAGTVPRDSLLDVHFELVDDAVQSVFVPEFSFIPSEILLETVPVFEIVTLVQATDADSNTLWYSIVDGADQNGFPMFSIQPLNGIVEVAGRLDYETKSEYVLNISATDGYNTGYGLLLIKISNVNEFQPQFDKRLYEVTVREDIPIGSDIIQLSADDEDANDVLVYLLHSANNNNSYTLFGVDHGTGIVSTLRSLDHETARRHELVVKVNDNGFKEYSDYARIIINVEDNNDHAPKFIADVLTKSIHERAILGTKVIAVQATDKDKGDNSRIQYSLQSGNVGYTFNIDANLGIVTLARKLDLKVRSQYELTIMANDMGTPQLSSTCLVKVFVTVADERPPSFVSTSFTAEIRENEPIGTFVTALSGESQSALTYEIVNPDTSSLFSINPNSGILTSNAVFDFEKKSVYNVSIRATDIIGHQVMLSVAVHIIDRNDNRPSFIQSVYRGYVSEGAQGGAVVLTNDSVPLILSAEDRDSNLNALLLYSIVGAEASRYFSVDRNTGAVRTVVTPDREMKSEFEFSVQVRDQAPFLETGEESLSAANPAQVIITIGDINDTPPVFSQTNSQTTLLTPTYEGVMVHRAAARDEDLNTELTYEIVNGNLDSKFAVERHTGVVYVKDPSNLRSSYSLVVKVSDGVHDAVYSLMISVIETSNSGLTFTESTYTGEVIENKTSTQTVLIVVVLNRELGEPVTFELLNYRDTFRIGHTSGVIETIPGAVIDRETRSSYEVIVRVASLGKEIRLAQVRVVVSVKDINDNAPYFSKDHYHASTTVDTARQTSVLKVKANDDDVGINSEIRYDIYNSATNDFRINRKTGDITVKRSLVDKANMEYTLTIVAADQGEPSLSTQTNLTIKVFAESTPNFTQVVYESSIPENIPISSAVTTVNAESTHGNKIIYTISEGDPDNEFTVHFSTGTISVNDDLDFELKSQYRLKIRAVDVVTGDWADAVVIINVQDVNDQKPYFGLLDYYKTVSEAITVGSHVMTVNASDADQGINSLIHYTLRPIHADSPHHLMFDISDTGDGQAEIRTVLPLDHERYQRLDFIVVATDGGNPRLSAEAYVHVLLNDLNDNPPLFEESIYTVEISDEVEKGQFVAMVGALDPDDINEGELMYNIVHGNEGQAFTINQNTGSVYVSPFHQTTMFSDEYSLNISVSDGIYTSFTSLTVTVRAANRHSPEFDSILYTFQVLENSEKGRVLGQVKANDEDKGQYGEITYSLVGDWVQDHFKIDQATGDISLKFIPDREQRDFFMLPVMAQDAGGKTEFTSVYVVVDDVNDNSPQFVASGYSATVFSNSSVHTPVIMVSAFDSDKQNNAKLRYFLLSDTPAITGLFRIDQDSGQISLARELLSNERDSVIEFYIRVTDSGEPALEDSALVTVTFTSEAFPVFRTGSSQMFLEESEPVGTEVTQVRADYTGDHRLSYRIRSGSSVRTNKPPSFAVDSEGHITTIRSLDRESQAVYEIVVEVFTHSEPELVASTLVRVSPIDSNDNPPEFTSGEYTVGIAESIPVGASILQVSAFDQDQDHESNIIYSFAPESKMFSNLFMVEPHHGWISSLVPLDREKRSSYEFYIQASDEDSRGKLSSKAKVKINLLDVNDCAPQFANTKLIGGSRYWNDSAAVNEDAPTGTIVVQVEAVDQDLPAHSTRMYYISNGNDHGHFRIKQTGEIFVSKTLDRESLTEYHLEVSATDGVFVSSIMVLIHILDANDNAPVCERPMYTKVIAENIASGSLILSMKASDIDEPSTPNSRISYSLRGEGSSDFAIDAIRGDIRVYRNVDRERKSEYRITGVATDDGGLYCTADILIKLTDVNDNTPVFDQSMYSYTLPEDSSNNTLLLRVTATDKDAGLNRKVRYSIELQRPKNMFTIDPANGIIRLVRPLREGDTLVSAAYTLTIAATDSGETPRTGRSQLTVHVSDVNDPPVFLRPLYDTSCSEDIEPGTRLLQVRALSTDKGRNNVIKYSISNGGANNQLFRMDADTGVLTTSGRFNYELVRKYVLNIEAKDEGEPPLSDMCTVTVYITDANDNKPAFSQTAYAANVRENAEVGDQVIRVEAQDLDSGLNARVVYSIIAGNDLRQFTIDENLGYVSVGASLDREAISSYTLTIQATDQGVEKQQMSQALLLVTIEDVNDNPPRFLQPYYAAQVQVYPEGGLYRNTTFTLTTPPTETTSSTSSISSEEGTETSGYSPLTLTVTDADDDHNSRPFKYEILSGDPDNHFSISSDGRLLARGTFDMKVKAEYTLEVKVEDSGVPPLSSFAQVKVEVHEATLSPPAVTSPLNFTVVAYEDTFPGGIIGYVKARDLDYDTLSYKIVSPLYQRLFSMDSSTGAFSSYSLDSGMYSLNVSVSDGRFTSYGVIGVKVVSITDEMMADSVGVLIGGITSRDFISLHRRAFEKALLELSSEFRHVHILSINDQPAASSARAKRQTTPSNSVLVLASVEISTGEMISKDILSSAIKDNINTVRSIMGGLEISLPGEDFVCPSHLSCNADEKCELQYQITQDKVTITSNQHSFVSLLAQPVDRCVCLGSTCANPCSSNPCPRQKHCIPSATYKTYSCQCPPGTFGDDCSRHDGSAIAFDGNSYVRWTLVNDIKTKMKVRLTFRTKQSDAVLMDARAEKDYSTLEVDNGYLRYTFECGSGPATMQTSLKVNDGSWHNVTLERDGNFARLLLDNKHTAQAESDRNTLEINLLDNNVFFGATVKTLTTASDTVLAGFKGCMKDIQVDRVKLPYSGANSVASAVRFEQVVFDCLETHYGECSLNPCLNGGTCQETGSGVFCSCQGFVGSRCETDLNECYRDNPCSTNSTCENLIGSFRCRCYHGMIGKTCHQKDECLSNPCGKGAVCTNIETTLGQGHGSYSCLCPEGKSGPTCEVMAEQVDEKKVPFLQIICAVGGILGLIIIIVVAVVVWKCVSRRRRQRKKMLSSMHSSQSERQQMLSQHRPSSLKHSQDLYRSPSPPPPSVPPRPVSYTPSVNESNSKMPKSYEMSHDYGSAADGLDRMGNSSIYSPELRDIIARTNPPKPMSTFAALPKLSPPPPSLSDTDSIIKPGWDFSAHTPGKDMSFGKNSDRQSRNAAIPAVAQHKASRAGSKAGSRSGSKPASNASFTSIPQEDEALSLASLRSKSQLSTAGRAGNKPTRIVSKGYHWDNSDWLPAKDDDSLADSRRDDREMYPAAARLMSMSEVDDSEYVEDSELDDDVIPEFSGPSYTDNIAAIQAQYNLDYDLPELNLPKSNRNHYLPSHGISHADRRHLGGARQPLLAAQALNSPAVPQRTASLGYSTDDICATGDEMMPLGGYTSMEAGDSQSELSENICEIESDCEDDVEGIINRVKNLHNSSV